MWIVDCFLQWKGFRIVSGSKYSDRTLQYFNNKYLYSNIS